MNKKKGTKQTQDKLKSYQKNSAGLSIQPTQKDIYKEIQHGAPTSLHWENIQAFKALKNAIRMRVTWISVVVSFQRASVVKKKAHFLCSGRLYCLIEGTQGPPTLPLSHLEANWQLLQLKEQECHLGIRRHNHHCWHCMVFKGSPMYCPLKQLSCGMHRAC